jgi:hypothetical protein
VALVGVPGPASAATNTPDYGSWVTGPDCGGIGDHWGINAVDWPLWTVGDYDGFIVYGNKLSSRCDLMTGYFYTTTQPSYDTFSWSYGKQSYGGGDGSVAGKTCYVWAYIPTSGAGAPHARYDVWGLQGLTQHWLFWPGRTIDQETTSGWIYLGEHAMGSNDTVVVTLGNHDSTPGQDVGAGAMAFHCF